MRILYFTLLFICLNSYGQSGELITLNDTDAGYSLRYPLEWDSTTFASFKAAFKADFGAIIKPGFNKSQIGAFFTITKAKGWGSDLNVVLRESEVSFRRAYPEGKILSSKILVSEANTAYHLFIIEVKQFGTTRIITKAQVLKNNDALILSFTCPNQSYENLKTCFEQVINSFKFESL